MRQTTAFRVSTYLTMSIACAALGYAESEMLPEVGVFSIVVLVALATIYRLETRVQLLSMSEANRLGAGIGLVAILWAGFRIVREWKVGEFSALGWPAFIVSLIAPVLMATVCAKLLRREKHAGDYWFIHAAGLATIVLAGAMAEQAILVALTALYAFTAIWSLSLFFLARSSGSVPTIPGRSLAATQAPIAIRTVEVNLPRSAGFKRALLLSGIAAAVALPLYLFTPRSTFGKLDFGQPRIEIGYAADQMIDLTQTGSLRENPETAFEVTALDASGQPKLDLDPDQRWRGNVLATYSAGAWQRGSQFPFPTGPIVAMKPGPWSPPQFGRAAYSLTLAIPAKLGAQFLADPVEWDPREPVPVADLVANGPPRPWMAARNGRLFVATPTLEATHYVQYTRPSVEKDLSPAFLAVSEINRTLVANPIPSVKVYSDRVLAEMVAAGRLPVAALSRDAVRLLPAELYHEDIARAFRDHLSERPDLVYTTVLKRVNKKVDPIEDFLLYSKAGHCERFASALVLMLRSQGIPAVMVLGFKGCEHTGGGHYLVRQEYAHAWVEALISRPNFAKQRREWHWLSLDPSPTQVANANDAGDALSWGRATFERFIFHYTPEQRERALRTIFDGLSSWELLGAVCGTGLAFLAFRTVRRRSARAKARNSHSSEWYERLIAVLARRGVKPSPGETPREFAETARAVLTEDARTASLADVPGEWVDAHYRQRFGGSAISEERRVELESRLDSLKTLLERKP